VAPVQAAKHSEGCKWLLLMYRPIRCRQLFSVSWFAYYVYAVGVDISWMLSLSHECYTMIM